ncbi:MAG: hypothetical protein H7A33_07800 [Deltaproteobacteria bacterium]|nr:hypothetical protein [Deltaproteobacteria bacterium]
MKFRFLFLLFVVFFSACQSQHADQATKEYLKSYQSDQAPLAVSYFSPTGLISNRQAQVVLRFSQPMVPLTEISAQKTKSLFEITPAVEGTYKWVNTQTLVFTPKRFWPASTRFTVTAAAGTESLLGFALLKEFSSQFETPSPLLESVDPQPGKKNIELMPQFVMRFNQELDPNLVRPQLQLLQNGTPRPYQIKCLEVIENIAGKKTTKPDCSRLTVKPETTFQKNSEIVLKLSKGVASPQGPLTSTVDYEHQFTTYSDFKITNITCEDPCYPQARVKIFSTTPLQTKDVIESVQFEPELKLGKDHYGYWDEKRAAFYLYVSLKPNTTYKVKTLKTLKDQFGQVAPEEMTGEFKSEHFLAGLDLMGTRHRVVLPDEDLRLEINARNTQNVVLQHKVFDSVNSVLAVLGNENKIVQEKGQGDGFWDGTKRLSGKVSDTWAPLGKKANELLEGRRYGILLSDFFSPEVRVYNSKEKLYVAKHHPQVTQITDLAIHAKLSRKDGLVWVTSVENASAKAQTRVQIYDAAGHRLHQISTDTQGLAKLPGLDQLEDLSRRNGSKHAVYPLYVFAERGGDRAFISTNWSNGLGYFSFYERDRSAKDSKNDASVISKATVKVRGHLLTDRGLYKPGETMHLKGYLRKVSDFGLQVFKEPITVKISVPRQKDPIKILATPNERGNFSVSYQIPETSPLGYYWVSLSSSAAWIDFERAHTEFQVEKFRTPDFFAKIEPARSDLVKGEKLNVKIFGEYLFGSPMAEATVDYSVSKALTWYSPNVEGDWQFGRLHRHREKADQEFYDYGKDLSDALNKEGFLNWEILTDGKQIDPLNLSLQASVFDFSHQQQFASKRVIVHPASYYIGGRIQGLIQKENEAFEVKAQAFMPNGEVAEGVTAQMDLYRDKWMSVQEEVLNGQFRTRNELRSEKVSSCEASLGKEAGVCSFTAVEAGSYFVRLSSKDDAGRDVITELPVYVSGSSYAYWVQEDSFALELVSEKNELQVGEEFQVLVKSPFQSGKALVTIERDGILSQEIVSFDSSAPVLKLKALSQHVPNFFVNVALIKGANEIDESHGDKNAPVSSPALIKLGQLEFNVAPQNKDLKVAVTADQSKYQPGQKATLNLKVENQQENASEFTVMVVDEGVLMAGGYQLKNPLSTLFSPYWHEVGALDSRVRFFKQAGLAKKMESEASGGGQEAGLRKNFLPSAFFKADVTSDENGEAQVSFTVPDQLTQFRVMVVANEAVDRFGVAEASFKVQKPLMIRAALPRFLRAGDQAQSNVVIHNNSDKEIKFTLTTAAEGAEVSLASQEELSVAAHATLVQALTIKAPSREEFLKEISGKIGEHKTVKLRLSAQSAEAQDAVEWSFPVSLNLAEEFVESSGVVTKEASEFVKKSPHAFDQLGQLRVAVSGFLGSQMAKQVQGLRDYPYACLEQRVSKLYPYVLLSDADLNQSGAEHSDYARDDLVKSFVQELSAQQSYYGEFALWPNGRFEPSVTLMVGRFLWDAKRAGFTVDLPLHKIRTQLFRYLQKLDYNLLKRSQAYQLNTKVESLYLLYLMGEAQPSYYQALVAELGNLNFAAQLHLIEMLDDAGHDQKTVDAFLSGLKQHISLKSDVAFVEGASSPYYFGFSQRVMSAQTAQFLLRVHPKHTMLFPLLRGLVENRSGSRYRSSLELKETLKAIKMYRDRFPEDKENLLASLKLNGQELVAFSLDRKKTQDEIVLPNEKLPEEMKFEIIKKNGSVLFYNMEYTTLLKEPRQIPVEQGLSLSKEYFTLDNQPVSPEAFKAGETYRVRLNIFANNDSEYLVLEDPLAAGLEPLNIRLNNTRQRLGENRQDTSASYLLSHREMHDDKVVLYFDRLPRGFWSFDYHVMVTNEGRYGVPHSQILEMYQPSVFGQSVAYEVQVQ